MKAKTIGIKALKDQLSENIRLVKNGVRVLITEHDTIVAEIVIPKLETYSKTKFDLLEEWQRAGKITLATAKRTKKMERTHIKLKNGTAQELLDADRGE